MHMMNIYNKCSSAAHICIEVCVPSQLTNIMWQMHALILLKPPDIPTDARVHSTRRSW